MYETIGVSKTDSLEFLTKAVSGEMVFLGLGSYAEYNWALPQVPVIIYVFVS